MLLSVDAKAAVRMLVSMRRAKLIQVLRSAVAPTQVSSPLPVARKAFAPQFCVAPQSRARSTLTALNRRLHLAHDGECNHLFRAARVERVRD